MKRSQAAIEFLMTYGWALLAIFAVVGVIVYFGFIDLTTFSPENCDMGYRLGCKDFRLNKGLGEIRLSVFNSFQDKIMLVNVTVNSTQMSGGCIAVTNPLEMADVNYVEIGEPHSCYIGSAGFGTVETCDYLNMIDHLNNPTMRPLLRCPPTGSCGGYGDVNFDGSITSGDKDWIFANYGPVVPTPLNITPGETKVITIACLPLAQIKTNKKVRFSVVSYYYLEGTSVQYSFPLYGEIYAKPS